MNEKTQFPVCLDIDLSSKCNLRCGFCHLSFFEPRDSVQITHQQFKQWVGPALGDLSSITLFSKFEPLTCRDFIPIFNEVSAHGIETYFSTNGTLLAADILDAIVGRLTFLTVSITGFTRETYAKHMGKDMLAKVQKNLDALNKLKAERGTRYPRLRISTVAMHDTLDELTRAVDFAGTFNAAEGLQVTSLIAYDDDMVAARPVSDPARFTRAVDEANSYAETKGVKFTLQSGSLDENEKTTRDIGHRHCRIPWNRLSIQPNGDVYPCPVAYEPIGSLLNETLSEIWNGGPLDRFRAGVNDIGNMNEDCRACTHCRHKSILSPDANDYSKSQKFIAGMTRKR